MEDDDDEEEGDVMVEEEVEDVSHTIPEMGGGSAASADNTSVPRCTCRVRNGIHVRRDPNVKSVLLLYFDGGSDHRLRYRTVQAALSALRILLNLDMVVAANTYPYHSFSNPVERIMAILNIALNGAVLERGEMGELQEQALHSCCSMAATRRAVAKDESKAEPLGLRQAWKESMDVPIKCLEGVFGRLLLKEEPFHVGKAATAQDMENLLDALRRIDCSLLDLHDCQKSKKYEEYKSNNVHSSKYLFSDRKCDKDACTICGPIIMPPEMYQNLHHAPLPTPSTEFDRKGKYKHFEEVYGKETTERFLPPLKSGIPKRKANEVKCHQNAIVARVQCTECGLWRCVFGTSKRIKQDMLDQLSDELEDALFSCGCSGKDLLDPNSVFYGKITTDIKLTCSMHMECAYYNCAKFPLCCSHCGGEEQLLDIEREEQQKAYLTVHPLCDICKAANLSWVCSRPIQTREADLRRRPPQRKKRRIIHGDAAGGGTRDDSTGTDESAEDNSPSDGRSVNAMEVEVEVDHAPLRGWHAPVRRRPGRGRGRPAVRGRRQTKKSRASSGEEESSDISCMSVCSSSGE